VGDKIQSLLSWRRPIWACPTSVIILGVNAEALLMFIAPPRRYLWHLAVELNLRGGSTRLSVPISVRTTATTRWKVGIYCRPGTSPRRAHVARTSPGTDVRHAAEGPDFMPDLSDPLDRRAAQLAPAETPGLRGLLTVAISVVVVAGLYLGRSMLIPITLAVLLSFLLAPLVNLLRRAHLGRIPSVLLAVLLALAVILALGGLIGTQVAGLAEEVPRYALTIQRKVDTVQQFMASRMTNLAGSLVHLPARVDVTPKIKPSAAPAATPSADAPKPIPVEVHQPDLTAIELAQRIVTPVVDPLLTTAIVLIVSIFMLLQREDLRDRMIRLFGSSDLHRTTVAMNDAARRLSRYLLTQLAVNAAFGVIIGTGLAFIGIPSPVMWGVLGALLRFVPYIGAPLSSLMPAGPCCYGPRPSTSWWSRSWARWSSRWSTATVPASRRSPSCWPRRSGHGCGDRSG